jgi:hypothetical protein
MIGDEMRKIGAAKPAKAWKKGIVDSGDGRSVVLSFGFGGHGRYDGGQAFVALEKTRRGGGGMTVWTAIMRAPYECRLAK